MVTHNAIVLERHLLVAREAPPVQRQEMYKVKKKVLTKEVSLLDCRVESFLCNIHLAEIDKIVTSLNIKV